jgi:hypothetical protein
MIKPPSLVREYDLVWSQDPALDAPVREHEESDDAWNERNAAWEKRLNVARETGDWSGVLKPGQQPTVFQCRRIRTDYWRRLQAEFGESGVIEATLTAVRLAVYGIANFGAVKIEREKGHPRYDDQLLAISVCDLLREFPGLIEELASAVISRETQLPKS